MWPTADAMIAIVRPCANATPKRPELWMNTIEPMPTKISAKVPMSSATPRRRASYSTRRGYERRRTASSREVRYRQVMAADLTSDTITTTSCPHCHRTFSAALIAGVQRANPEGSLRSRLLRERAALHAVLERLRLGQALELLQRVVLDLMDPLSGDAECAPDLLERVRLRSGEAEAELDHLSLPLRQRHQRLLDVL